MSSSRESEGMRPFAPSVARWLATRFEPWRFAPQAALLALAAQAPLVSGTLRALLVLLALRLEKDLLDRERDRRESPERVLATASAGPFAALLALALAGSIALGERRLVLAALFALAALGHGRPRLGLAKYGLAVLALAPAWSGPVLLAALAVTLTYLLYEILHDRRTRDGPLPLEAALFAALPAFAGAPLVALGVAVAFSPLLLAHGARAPGRWCEAVFLLGALEVLACRCS